MCGGELQVGNWPGMSKFEQIMEDVDKCEAGCLMLAINYLAEEISGHVTCTKCSTTYSKTGGGPVLIHVYDYPDKYTTVANKTDSDE